MSDASARQIRRLLALLEVSQPVAASRLRAELTERAWQVGPADLDRVLDALEQAQAPALVTAEPETSPDPGAALASGGHCFDAFVAGIPRGADLVAGLRRLALAETYSDAVEATRRVFVDGLGFAPRDLDETVRLEGKGSLTALRAVASHAGFMVVVGSLPSTWGKLALQPYPFRLHRNGLLVLFTPDWRTVRFVFRRTGSKAGDLGVRTLVGGRFGREAHDNVVVWAMRLSRMRPRAGDGAAEVATRAAVAFDHRFGAREK